MCKSLLGDRRARGERAHERALSDARPCGAGSAECSQSGFTLYRKGELFGDPCNFGSDLVTSKQLAESFPTAPNSPSNSQGKPVYILSASALHPLTVAGACGRRSSFNSLIERTTNFGHLYLEVLYRVRATHKRNNFYSTRNPQRCLASVVCPFTTTAYCGTGRIGEAFCAGGGGVSATRDTTSGCARRRVRVHCKPRPPSHT